MIRVVLPFHLRILAQAGSEVALEIDGPVTQRSVVDTLEARYPMLRGTLRDQVTLKARPMIRFYAVGKDWTHEPPDTPFPDAVATGAERLFILGAISGG